MKIEFLDGSLKGNEQTGLIEANMPKKTRNIP